jgi:hypothetical protein
MLSQQFSERAAECMRLAGRSRSERDRIFFVAMARAWLGAVRPDDESVAPPRPIKDWRSLAGIAFQ